jgi:hypothetical protein
VLLLITGSADGTADRIVSRYGDGIFRFNYNLWKEYKVSYTPTSWSIENPAGLKITSETATNVFWWKAFAYMTQDDRMIKEEVKYFLRDIYGWFQVRGLSKGNSINYHNTYGKINILGIANKYFKIPSSLFSIGLEDTSHLNKKRLITKSLSSEISSDNKVLMATKIPSIERLDKNFPWFLQTEVISDWDITIFICGKKNFAFKRSRNDLKGIDWRAEQDFEYTKQEWFPFDLSSDDEVNIFSLAADLDIEFGRFDFMTEGSSNELVFLEMNATGQWVFLDIKEKYGILDHVVNWLKN